MVAVLQQRVLSVALGAARQMRAVRTAAVSAIGGYGTRSNPVAGAWIGCRFKRKRAVRAGARQSEERGMSRRSKGRPLRRFRRAGWVSPTA